MSLLASIEKLQNDVSRLRDLEKRVEREMEEMRSQIKTLNRVIHGDGSEKRRSRSPDKKRRSRSPQRSRSRSPPHTMPKKRNTFEAANCIHVSSVSGKYSVEPNLKDFFSSLRPVKDVFLHNNGTWARVEFVSRSDRNEVLEMSDMVYAETGLRVNEFISKQ